MHSPGQPSSTPGRAPSTQAARLPRPAAPLPRPAARACLCVRCALRPCAPTLTPQRLRTPAACAPQRPACAFCAPCAPSAPQRLLPSRLLAVSWFGWALYRNTVQPCLCSTVAIHLSVLRYNSSLPSLLLQYNCKACNTN